MSRDIDLDIAYHIFNSPSRYLGQTAGWRIDWVSDKDECNNPIVTDMGNDGYRLKYYSSNIRDAMNIIDHLRTKVEAFSFVIKETYDGTFMCRVEGRGSNQFCGLCLNADTIPMAICLATFDAFKIERVNK